MTTTNSPNKRVNDASINKGLAPLPHPGDCWYYTIAIGGG